MSAEQHKYPEDPVARKAEVTGRAKVLRKWVDHLGQVNRVVAVSGGKKLRPPKLLRNVGT